MKPKAIITRRWPKRVEEKAQTLFEATLNETDKPMSQRQLAEAMEQADILMPTVTDAVTKEVINTPNRKAKIIGNFGVGFNNIDIEAAKAAGVVVTNTPEVLTDCTADIALTLILSVARRTSEGERELRSGNWIGWRPTHLMGHKVTGSTLALVGFGRIGQALAQKAHNGLGMKILFHDPYFKGEPSVEAENCAELDEMLSRADFVSIHCPATKETEGFFDAAMFRKMPNHSFLINTARGNIVNEADLVQALRDGEIGGAGLDVYEKEPAIHPELLKIDKNVVLLPHLGSASLTTREAMGFRVLENAEAFFKGEKPKDRVV